METHARAFDHANAMPAATWHSLRMNDTRVEIPEGLSSASIVRVERVAEQGPADAFDVALADAQGTWERLHPAPTAEDLAEAESYRAAEADATYGGTARSAYQVNADAIEASRSLARAFEWGASEELAAFLGDAAHERIVIAADPGEVVDVQVMVEAAPDVISAAAVDVVAAAGSTVSVSLSVDGTGAGPGDIPIGVTGSAMRVFAGEGAQVSIVRTQSLDDGYIDIDDMGLFAADNAHIEVRQTVLGAGEAFTGLAGDLRGEAARIDVDTRYLGYGRQQRDFNYVLRHHGANTECMLQANGVLAGTSSKTLRGTIDLIRGAKGARGAENETVLLVDEGVHNKTVPVILCNEDDVAGNHGATIGHIREEQLFYLASRGLSREAAERMFVSAVVERAAIDALDEASRAAVLRFGERLQPGFASWFEEEA